MGAQEKFPGVFLVNGKLAVKANHSLFGEIIEKGYRFWDPNRSKLGAALMKGLRELPIKPSTSVLYLGAAHGFTTSFISDIVGSAGIIYAVEFSERCFKELLPIAEKLKNVVPIKGDARMPETYSWIEKVDVVYCDIADPQQTEVALRNCSAFLKPAGYLMLAIKTQSIDVTAQPAAVAKSEAEKLRKAGFDVLEILNLEPFEEKHYFILARSRA